MKQNVMLLTVLMGGKDRYFIVSVSGWLLVDAHCKKNNV